MKTYEQELLLRTCDCDFTGCWRPSAIMEAMQEMAGIHSYLIGCGREELLKHNIVWIMTRCEIHMLKYPRIGDRVKAQTFPTANRRWFFPRYYSFISENGEALGYAATLWALLDIDSRRMLPPGDVASILPDNSDLPLPMGLPATVDAIEGEERILRRIPSYFDLDVNQHVNNTRYADWACDALGVDLMRDFCLESMLINFNAEIMPDQPIMLHVSQNGLSYRVAGYHEDKLHFEVGGQLKKREEC